MDSSNLSYRASLKDPAVEEPIDLLFHRPLGYLLARLCMRTPVTPDQLTIFSMLLGITAGVLIIASVGRPGLAMLPHAAALYVLSAIVDCADGQLARMRRTSSRFGRMLDGAVDAVVQVAVVPPAIVHMFVRRGGLHDAGAWAWSVAAVVAILIGIRHTTLYDHYKNLWVRNSSSTHGDCDDREDLEQEIAAAKARGPLSWADLFRFAMYATHLSLVEATMRWIDPAVPARFRDMPPYSEARAEHYRALNRALMRAWSFFGIGTHIFIMAIALACDRIEAYVLVRLVAFNVALAVMVPLQRRASRVFFGTAQREGRS
jgi:phosphatidylglycerophosphate synthase